jgi:Protein of unknown function DUF86
VPPSVADRVRHILEAIREIETALSRVDYRQFEGDLLLRLAVERLLEIVCEASKYIPADVKARPMFLGGRSRTSAIGCAMRITASMLPSCGTSRMKISNR